MKLKKQKKQTTATSQFFKTACHQRICSILTEGFPHHSNVLLALMWSGKEMGSSSTRNPQRTRCCVDVSDR